MKPSKHTQLESKLNSSKGGGSPLDDETRGGMESSFGADFSGVRIHTDSESSQMNTQLSARAFTHGNDIYFNEGQYQPGSNDGQKLLAHELTHTIQQGASTHRKEIQKKPISQVDGPKVQRGLFSGLNPITGLINRILRNVPGWTLLTVIIGKNPVTGDAVPRTATNVLDGMLGLMPGGGILADKLKETGALQDAGNWLSSEIDKLGFSLGYIKGLISQAWDEVSISNGWSKNVGIVKRIFGAPYRKVKAFAGRIVDKIKEFVFRGALKLVGAPVDMVMGILNKGASVIKAIISNPIGFLGNLIKAVGGGIKSFMTNIGTHLKNGLVQWLTGAMSALPINIPKAFDLKGVLSLVLQLLGMSWGYVRGKTRQTGG